LQYVRATLHFWNEIDGWSTKSFNFIPPNAPTSDPYSFYAAIIDSWCVNCGQDYNCKNYKFTTLLDIIYGGNGSALVIDEYQHDSESSGLKFCKQDKYFYDKYNCSSEICDCSECNGV
jgi:hypothetical protein